MDDKNQIGFNYTQGYFALYVVVSDKSIAWYRHWNTADNTVYDCLGFFASGSPSLLVLL